MYRLAVGKWSLTLVYLAEEGFTRLWDPIPTVLITSDYKIPQVMDTNHFVKYYLSSKGKAKKK
jgi:hypothetical protein